jgi:hypothetical protein
MEHSFAPWRALLNGGVGGIVADLGQSLLLDVKNNSQTGRTRSLSGLDIQSILGVKSS